MAIRERFPGPSTLPNGEVIRTFAGDGIVSTTIGKGRATIIDPQSARAWAADLTRMADEAERIERVHVEGEVTSGKSRGANAR